MSTPAPPDRPDPSARRRGPARPRTERPAPKAGRSRSGPPTGEGWDDGRGHRVSGKTGSGAAPGRARTGPLARLPRWAIPAAGATVVLLLVIAVLVMRGGGERTDAGSCLTDLATQLPASSTRIWGTDLVQARHDGYDDAGTLEELGSSQTETGALPDELSKRYRYSLLLSAEQFTARTGVEHSDIDCSLSDGTRTVMTGSFDPTAVSGSTAAEPGNLAASEDRLALVRGDRDPKAALEPRSDGGIAGNDDVARTLTALRDARSYSVLVEAGNPRAERRARAAGIGVGPATDGDGRTLVVAWAFAGDDAAKAGRRDIVARVNAALQGNTQITSADLEVDGSLVTATIDTRKAADLSALVSRGVDLLPRG